MYHYIVVISFGILSTLEGWESGSFPFVAFKAWASTGRYREGHSIEPCHLFESPDKECIYRSIHLHYIHVYRVFVLLLKF